MTNPNILFANVTPIPIAIFVNYDNPSVKGLSVMISLCSLIKSTNVLRSKKYQ
jgi:hypothetical protein